MIERREMLAELISLENGKALPDAAGEVAYAAEFFRWFAEEAVRLNGELAIAPSGANRILVEHQPIGVAVLVTPWNFPAAMATRKIAPGARRRLHLRPEARHRDAASPPTSWPSSSPRPACPPGVVNVLTTSRSGATVSAMLHDPRVRKLSFTGSTEVGRTLLKEAADQVLNCSMELGGNAPFVVFDDADLDAALDGAMIAKMRNGGEACTAANRFFVQDGILDALHRGPRRAHVGADRRPRLRPGHQGRPDDQRQGRRHASPSLVDDAVARGARVVTGGKALDRDGFYFPPTVLDRVPAGRRHRPRGDLRPRRRHPQLRHRGGGRSRSPTTPSSASSPTSTPATSPAACASPSGSRPAWSASTAASSPTPPRPSAASSRAASAARAAHHGILEFCETKYIAASW